MHFNFFNIFLYCNFLYSVCILHAMCHIFCLEYSCYVKLACYHISETGKWISSKSQGFNIMWIWSFSGLGIFITSSNMGNFSTLSALIIWVIKKLSLNLYSVLILFLIIWKVIFHFSIMSLMLQALLFNAMNIIWKMNNVDFFVSWIYIM